MASSKGIFEAHMWRADMFGAGLWRGTGPAVSPDCEGIEYHLSGERMHYSASGRLHYRAAGWPMHYKALEDDG